MIAIDNSINFIDTPIYNENTQQEEVGYLDSWFPRVTENGPRVFYWFNKEWEVAQGELYHNELVGEYGGLKIDPDLQKGLESIMHNLTSHTERSFDWNVYILNSTQKNSAAAPGGNVYLFDGLIQNIESAVQAQFFTELWNTDLRDVTSEDILAALVAHEMSHIDRGHGAQDTQRETITAIACIQIALYSWALTYKALHSYQWFSQMDNFNIVSIVPGTILKHVAYNATAHLAVASIFFAVWMFYILPQSRAHEYEADLYGMHLMEKAGYNPKGMLCLDYLFLANRNLRPDQQPISLAAKVVLDHITSTHPHPYWRMQAICEALESNDSGVV